MPIIFIAGIIIIRSLLEDIDLTNFTPIFGNGIKDVFLDGSFALGRYEVFFIFLLLAPSIKDLRKTVSKTFLAASLLLLVCFFMFFGIFPYPSITENYSLLYELVRMVSYGRFIQRIESIFLPIWLIATFMYFAITLSLSVQTLKKMFAITYYKRLVPSLAIIIISVSLLLHSHADVIELRKILTDFACPMFFIYAFVLLIIARIKLKFKEKIHENS